jgi:branched-chain amino acid transport system substrate-binding protein
VIRTGTTKAKRLFSTLAVVVMVSAGCASSADDKVEAVRSSDPAPDASAAPEEEAAATPTEAAPEASAGEATPAETPASPTAAGPAAPTGPQSGSTKTPAAPAGRAPATAAAPASSGKTSGGASSAPSNAPAPTASGAAAPSSPAPAPTPGGPAPAAPPAPAAARPLIKLGAIGTDTGPIGQAISHSRSGLKAWLADVNARGGLNGHPVQIVFGDDGGDPARALSLGKQMVEQDKVIAFAGIYGPTSGQGLSPYLEQKKVPGIEICSCTDTGDSSPMLFPVGNGPTEGNAWSHIAPVMELSDKRNVGLMYCREVKPCSQINDFLTQHEKELGIKLVYRAQIALAQPDYTAEVLAARNAGADVLVLVTVNSGSVRIARSAHRQGYFPAMATQFNAYDERFLKDGGEDVEGFLTVARTAPWSLSPKMAEFRTALAKYAPDAINTDHTAMGWAVGKLLEKMSAGYPAGVVTSNDFLEGLYALRGESLDGLIAPLTYERDKGHQNTNQCNIPIIVKGGKFVAPGGDKFSCAPWWTPPKV